MQGLHMKRTEKRYRIAATARFRVQLAVFLVTIAIGLQFFVYVHQASGPGPVTVSRPPGVEGFLPIGALMSWKRFFLTGDWDPVHPAAMVIIGFAVVLSFLIRKTFCGWFCPVGTFSEWCWRMGRRLFGRERHIVKIVDVPLRGVKYILLGFFIFAVSTMSADKILAFVESPYYKLSDVKMLYFFTRMTLLTAGVLAVLVILSLLYKNFWCRYLCPYGALLGLFSWISPTRIQRSESLCTRCGRCDEACAALLPVSRKKAIRSPECTGCMDCVLACPVGGALSLETSGLKTGWRPGRLGILIALLFVTVVYVAEMTGHWQGRITDEEFRTRLETIDSPGNTHPSIDF